MQLLAAACEAVSATTKKTEKIAIVAEYVKSRTVAEAALSALFFSGRPFAAYEERTLQVGGAILWRVIADISGASDAELTAAYKRHGDLGNATFDVLSGVAPGSSSLSLQQVAHAFNEIAAASGTAPKTKIVRELVERATPLEAKCLVKIITGELRIGLKESQVEEAIAKALKDAAKERALKMIRDFKPISTGGEDSTDLLHRIRLEMDGRPADVLEGRKK